jgi:hypothetical protein
MAKSERKREIITSTTLEVFLQDHFKKAWEKMQKLSEKRALYAEEAKKYPEHEAECGFVIENLKKKQLVIYGRISIMEELGKHFGIELQEPDGMSG